MDLKKLRELAERATPGPWHVHDCGYRLDKEREACGIATDELRQVPWLSTPERLTVFRSDAYDECSHPIGMNDAAFIAAFNPQMALELLDELERMRANAEPCWAPPGPNGGDTMCGHPRSAHGKEGCEVGVDWEEGYVRCQCQGFVERAREAGR